MSTDPDKILNPDGESEDLSDALASIADDLGFGQEDGDKGGKPAGEPAGEPGAARPPVETPPAQIKEDGDQPQVGGPLATPPAEIPPANTPDVVATGAPETWTKEALAEWAKIPPVAQAEILKREEDMHRGIAGYKEKADLGSRYEALYQPYAPILAAENINPDQLFSAFAANHYLMSRGTEDQKYAVAKNVLDGYGLDINRLIGLYQNQPQRNPEIDELRRQLTSVTTNLSQRDQEASSRAHAENLRQIEIFAAQPEHQYFREVADDIAALLRGGGAQSLQEAYDKAVFANPVTRQKEIDRLTTEKVSAASAAEAERIAAAKRAKSADVSTSQTNRGGTTPKGSMDDTLRETFEAIQARG